MALSVPISDLFIRKCVRDYDCRLNAPLFLASLIFEFIQAADAVRLYIDVVTDRVSEQGNKFGGVRQFLFTLTFELCDLLPFVRVVTINRLVLKIKVIVLVVRVRVRLRVSKGGNW